MSRAAEKMDLSQPSVSLLIQALEQDLGHRLFERQGPRISLTAEGRKLLGLALPLVEGLEALPETFEEQLNQSIGGRLRIAAGEATTLYLLPEPLRRFHAAYPQVRLRLDNTTGPDRLVKLRAGEVEMAVGSLWQVPDDIQYTPLYAFDPMLITARDHPLAGRTRIRLQDISPHSLILPPGDQTTAQMVELVFSQHNIDYHVTLETGGWEVIKRFVETGLGISIVTSLCLRPTDDLARIGLSHYFPKRTYGLILRRDKYLSPAGRRFIEMLAPQALASVASSLNQPLSTA